MKSKVQICKLNGQITLYHMGSAIFARNILTRKALKKLLTNKKKIRAGSKTLIGKN